MLPSPSVAVAVGVALAEPAAGLLSTSGAVERATSRMASIAGTRASTVMSAGTAVSGCSGTVSPATIVGTSEGSPSKPLKRPRALARSLPRGDRAFTSRKPLTTTNAHSSVTPMNATSGRRCSMLMLPLPEYWYQCRGRGTPPTVPGRQMTRSD